MSDYKTDMDTFWVSVSSEHPSAFLTSKKITEDSRGFTSKSEEDQMMANLSLTTEQREERGSKTIPSIHGEYSKAAKKNSFFIAPRSQEELGRYCFSVVGQVSTVYLKKGCKTSHRRAHIEVKTNDAYVMKTAKEGLLITTTSTT